jgi:phage terminase large subunit GpA-like protein
MTAYNSALHDALASTRRQRLKPPPRRNLVEWADECRRLSPEASSKPGRWKTSRVQVARGPMMAISDPECHTVTVQACTQLMKTEFVLNIIGYHIDQDPAPMLIIQPTEKGGEAFSKDRVDPMMRDTPTLRDKVGDKRQRDSGNTILHKQFPGGHLTIVGANAPGDLAMRPVRLVLFDETDKYPASAGKEGDPIALASERAATFWNYKIVHCCSPTIEGNSRINQEYLNGDQRTFCPACPHCGHREEMTWGNVKWEPKRPETAMYHCPGCGVGWTETERLAAIEAAGDLPDCGWIAAAEFNGHASFKVSKLASPWEPLSKLARKFLKAKDKPELLKAFINTQLAETYKEKGDAPPWKTLYDRRESYLVNLIQPRALVLTAGADVQKDRIEVEIVSWCQRLESWSVDYRTFPGDTADIDSPKSPYRGLEDLLNEIWQSEVGALFTVSMLAIDSGYNTAHVLNWVRKQPANRVIAVVGRDTLQMPIGQPQVVDINRGDGKRKKRGAKQWPVGDAFLKTELYGFLKQESPTAESGLEYPHGYCHFPQYDEHFFRGITAEEVVFKVIKGYRRAEWVKNYERNEPLDCRKYARAAAALLGIDRWTADKWAEISLELGVSAPEPPELPEKTETETVNGVEITRRKSKFWNR